MFGLVMQTSKPLDAAAPVAWTEVEPRLVPLMTECDALYKALMRTRQACIVGSVEDAQQAHAELTDAYVALTQLLPELFPGDEARS